MTGKKRAAYWGILLLVFIALTVIDITIFRVLNQNNELVSRSRGEQAINDFFPLFRDIETVDEARNIFETRQEQLIGVGSYQKNGEALFHWGTAPGTIDSTWELPGQAEPRKYYPSRKNESIIILQQTPPRPDRDEERRDQSAPSDNENRKRDLIVLFFHADIVYWEVSQPEFWNRRGLYRIILPLTEIILAAAILYIGRLIQKNSEYRQRIEEQKNLVVLGNAASTLAHEIKNPLSTIRLQTEILKRSTPEGHDRELGIINGEVDRLTMLTHHVNDYLRDPRGKRETLDPVPVIRDTARRILGEERITGKSQSTCTINIDRERFRSVVENLLINAIESGTKPEDISIETGSGNGRFYCSVLDRGEGISEDDLTRIYDPFFTTKSSGTGIGLAVVRRFIESAGGTCVLLNRQGGGAEARIELPATMT